MLLGDVILVLTKELESIPCLGGLVNEDVSLGSVVIQEVSERVFHAHRDHSHIGRAVLTVVLGVEVLGAEVGVGAGHELLQVVLLVVLFHKSVSIHQHHFLFRLLKYIINF